MRFKEFMTEIKIGSKGGNVDAFLADFNAGTTSNPFQPRMAVWQDSIGIELSKFSGTIHISSIMSFIKKNDGQASAALKWICSLADTHGVVLDLTVVPIQNAGAREGKDLTKSQLKAWYARNGFEKKMGDRMVRQPKKNESERHDSDFL